MRLRLTTLLGVYVAVSAGVAILAVPVAAQTVDPFDAVAAAVMDILREQQSAPPGAAQATAVDALATAVDQLPRTSPRAKQVAAPSAAGAGTVSDAPSFPELFGLALDSDLVRVGKGALTLDLNLFGFRTLFKPEVLDRQTAYGSHGSSLMRRVGGALTFGDGRGASAESPFDIVTWEVRGRVAGSRDRRDFGNFRKYEAAVLAPESDIGRAIGDFVRIHLPDISGMLVNNVLDAKKFRAFLKEPRIVQELAGLAPRLDEFIRAHDAITSRIDRATVWTVVAGGTWRNANPGPDRLELGIRGVAGFGPVDHTWNLEWVQNNGLDAFPDASTWKAAYAATALVLQGTALTRDGAELSVSVAAERYRNVRGAAHDTVVKANATLALPIGRGMTLPATITYANHRDLLADSGEVIGHVGLALDLSEFRKKAN
jgi:hypothetical protein